MQIITISQIVISIILIGLILIQERESGMSGVFGGGGMDGGVYQKRRGLEKTVFIGTIVFGILFAGLSVVNLVI